MSHIDGDRAEEYPTPIVDWIGNYPVTHGERGGELDPEHPDACLCGHQPYWGCPDWVNGSSLANVTVERDHDDGTTIVISGDLLVELFGGEG